MSSENTMNYSELSKLIKACGESGVKDIKLPNGVTISFMDIVKKEEQLVGLVHPIDFKQVVSDNESKMEDVSMSEEIAADAMEDIMLTDPLLYEESIVGLVNDKDR